MPIVAHTALPAFAELRDRGDHVLTAEQARSQDIRELHVGLLNLMPDAAFHVTERQFIHLLGSSNRIVQLHVHPFTVPGIARGPRIAAHIDRHYATFDELRTTGLDALVVTGANVVEPDLALEPFWDPLGEVMAWAEEAVTSTLCSCLASHVLLQRRHGIRRRRLPAKRWGVLSHRIVRPHPLLHGTNTRFDVPHSRWNEVTSEQLGAAGLEVLVEGVDGDVHLATSADGIRTVYLQGHPEYDAESLLKEHKREVARFAAGELELPPPVPTPYLAPEAVALLDRHVAAVRTARDAGTPPPDYPEAQVTATLDDTWADTATAVFANWLGLVYRLTDVRRGVPFAPGIDPADPLGRRDRART